MNTAQQVRVWVALAISALLGIGVVAVAYFATNPLYTDPTSGIGIYDVGAIRAWIGWVVILLVADAVLAGFTIFRMFRPLPREHQQPLSATFTVSRDGNKDNERDAA